MKLSISRIGAENAATEYTRRNKPQIVLAVLGNGAGTVDVPNESDRVYVRIVSDDYRVTTAYVQNAIDRVEGLSVLLQRTNEKGATQYATLGLAPFPLYPDNPWAGVVANHADNHERMDFGVGGKDPLNVWTRMMPELRACQQATPDMTVYVQFGKYDFAGTTKFWTGGSSSAITAPVNVNERRCDLLYLNSSNALAWVTGTPQVLLFGNPTRPATPGAGALPIAYVYSYYGQTSIVEADIEDARLPFSSQGAGATVALHNVLDSTYHGDVLTGSIARGDILRGNSTPKIAAYSAKTIGFYLVGDGTDLVSEAWDWDRAASGAGADMVHSHATAGEGGTLADEVVLHDKVGSPTLFTLHDDWITRGSSGVVDGTLQYVTVGSTAVKISVAAGDGYVRTTNDQQGELVFCHWNAAVDLYTFSAPAAGQENVRFIGVEYSGGVVSAVDKANFSDWNWFTNFPLARCSYDGTTMRIANLYAHAEDTANFARKVLRLTHPFEREEAPEGTGGLEISDVATRQIAMTAGRMWHGFNNLIINAIAAGTTFYTYYQRAGGGFNSGTATQWENTLYEDGSGTLATMTNNRYGTRWIYLDVSGNTVGSAYNASLAMIYGTSNATSVANAQAETAPSIPAHLQYHGRLVGRIIFQKSAAAATLVESAWTNLFAASAVGNHALLSNLDYASAAHTGFVPDTRTVNGKALSSNITLGLASSDFANQGTATTVLHGNAAGNPAFSAVVEADLGLTDLTTANATTSAHGFVVKAVAPAANILNVVGIANGETAYSVKSIFDATAPTTIAEGASASAGTSLIAAHRDHTHGAPSTWAATAHNIFSTTHGDTTGAASPVDGDIIIGNVTPKWSKLAITVPAANILNVLGVANGETRPSWKSIFDATNPADTGTAAPGTSLIAAHRDHVHALATPGTLTVSTTNSAVAAHTHAITSSSNPGAAAAILATSASGVLMLGSSGVGQPFQLYRDANAGDSANNVELQIGNSGAAQGRGILQFYNAAATGAPLYNIEFQPRNNADTTNFQCAAVRFYKTAAASSGYIAFYTNNGSAYAERARIDTAGNVLAEVGLHVGGTSDPGDNNLLVDGTATITGNTLLTTKITTYNNVSTEGYGVPAIVNLVALTGQSASIAATNITNSNVNGLYRVTGYLVITTTGNAVNVTFTLTWNDGAAARSLTSDLAPANATSVANRLDVTPLASYIIYVGNSTAMQYSTTVSGAIGAGRYSLYLVCERLN